jgi:SSS family solute:Na+ symporter
LLWTVTSFLFFTGMVGFIAWIRTRRENLKTTDGYFLAGRGLTGWVIAGSMILTNLSAEHLVGLNGQSYAINLSGMAWECTAAFATIIMALYFLPRYLRGAFTTLPEFFEDRYDASTRRLMSLLLLAGYMAITLPAGVLYPGAVAVNRIFNIGELFNVDYGWALWISVWFIGVVGAVYAIVGGLKAVAVSDSVNGVGLLIGGLLVPVFGLVALGDGSLGDGLTKLVEETPLKLNAIGGPEDHVPFGTIFTGMIFANLFYWGTNQAVIQRSLGAKSLKEGQKGVLLTGVFKIFVPLIMMVPGIIAFQMFPNLRDADLAYPTLIAETFPKPLLGFFIAVLLGAVLSTYNSLLNSAATVFCLDIYKPVFKPDISEAELIQKGKFVATIVAIVTLFVAPFILFAPEGLYQFSRRSTGFYNIPMIALVLTGFFTKRVSGIAARVAVIFYIITYILLVFVFDEPINFIHLMGILFVFMVVIMLIISRFKPRETPYFMHLHKKAVDLTPWKWGPILALIIMGLLVFVYILCSPIGLASTTGLGTSFYLWTSVLITVFLFMMVALLRRQGIINISSKPDGSDNEK